MIRRLRARRAAAEAQAARDVAYFRCARCDCLSYSRRLQGQRCYHDLITDNKAADWADSTTLGGQHE